jgi:DNA-binding transcriptional MerR regulator
MPELASMVGKSWPEIPDKLYFRIGEVSRLAGIKPYVLRFWETEFPQLKPKVSGKGQRLYRRKDVELVLEIKRLLFEKRYTILGARTFLDSWSLERGGRREGGLIGNPRGVTKETPLPERPDVNVVRGRNTVELAGVAKIVVQPFDVEVLKDDDAIELKGIPKVIVRPFENIEEDTDSDRNRGTPAQRSKKKLKTV